MSPLQEHLQRWELLICPGPVSSTLTYVLRDHEALVLHSLCKELIEAASEAAGVKVGCMCGMGHAE